MFSAQDPQRYGPAPSATPSSEFQHAGVNLWCEEALQRLKTSNRADTETIIKLVPVDPQALLQVLESRWDGELDSLLQSLKAKTPMSQDGSSSSQNLSPAQELITLLIPYRDPSHCMWNWAWTPGNPYDQSPAVVAEEAHSHVYEISRNITMGELIRDTLGLEAKAVKELLYGAAATSMVLRQRYKVLKRDKKRYKEVEEALSFLLYFIMSTVDGKSSAFAVMATWHTGYFHTAWS
jgi:hypothetical protein